MNPIETFEKMLVSGQDSEMLRFTLGNAYYANKEFVVAAEHFAKSVELKSDYSAAWKMLGRSLAEQGNHEEAVQAYDSGMQAAKNNGDKQTEKEITVFRRRSQKQLDAE